MTTLLERLQGVAEKDPEKSELPSLESRQFDAARALVEVKRNTRFRARARRAAGLHEWEGAVAMRKSGYENVRCGGHGGTCGKPCEYEFSDRQDKLHGPLKPVDRKLRGNQLGPDPAPLDRLGAAQRRALFLEGDDEPRHTQTIPMCSDCRNEMRALGILR